MNVASQNQDREEGEPIRLWFEAALVAGKWTEKVRLSISNGLIVDIESNVRPQDGDQKGSVGIPGLTNLHSHAFQRGMAGLAEVRGPGSDTFWTWREIMYHFLDRLTPEDMEAIAALAYIEMLESGFTRVGEFHYVHHDCNGLPYDNIGELAERICGAAQSSGINLTLLPSFYAHAGFGGLDPTMGQRRFITSIDDFALLFQRATQSARSLPGATMGVAPHSLRAVTPGELGEIISLCQGYPVHIHAAEQVKEVEECVAATGARPVEWLLDHAPLDQHWCLIHATHMTPEEIEGVVKSGATVGLCPITEANLGDGVFPASSFITQGGQIGIGTDSNIRINAAAELCMLEYSQRLTSRGRNVLAQGSGISSGRSLFDMALHGGLRAANVPMGELARGHPADIVVLACDYEWMVTREREDTIFDRLIFGGQNGCAIDSVWVRGKRVVSGGHHVHGEKIIAGFRRSLRRILSA